MKMEPTAEVTHLELATLHSLLELELNGDGETDACETLLDKSQWSHLNGCRYCQERLRDAAADETVRVPLSSVLREVDSESMDCNDLAELSHLGMVVKTPERGQEYLSIKATLEQWLQPPTHPELLGRLERYEVESIVGWGGMGVVLKALDSELRRPVAIKILLPRWADNPVAKQRFLREARSAASVLHPSVIAIHGIHQHRSLPYLVMPLIAGPSLQQLVQQQGALEERQVVQIAWQLASGLAAAHAQGVVHRDIKPGNILLDNAVNRVVITDFGLARCQDDQLLTQTGWLAGTPGYMSPEQCRGEDLDGRSDLYSLGAVLFWLCSGQLPFQSETTVGMIHQVSQKRAPDVRQLNPGVSPTLAALIGRLLEARRENRLENAAEVADYLEQVLRHLNGAAAGRAPQLPAIISPWRKPMIAMSVLLVGALSVVAAWSPMSRWLSPGKGLSGAPGSGVIAAGPAPNNAALGADLNALVVDQDLARLEQEVVQFWGLHDPTLEMPFQGCDTSAWEAELESLKRDLDSWPGLDTPDRQTSSELGEQK